MNIRDILTLYDYNYWAKRRILAAAAHVSPERVLWHCLLHVVNHGTHHRSQAAAILRGYGSSPGGLDFTAFLNEQR